MRNLFSSALLTFVLLAFYSQPGRAQSGAPDVTPTEISAELGGCSALINVTGADSKPVYSAKISARIHYGFAGLKKVDLETFTSAKGQAKIVKLPEVPKKPIYIYVSKDDKTESVEFTPDVHCQGTYDVVLK
jgi:hypothetical protein